jgi:hypothetical protein
MSWILTRPTPSYGSKLALVAGSHLISSNNQHTRSEAINQCPELKTSFWSGRSRTKLSLFITSQLRSSELCSHPESSYIDTTSIASLSYAPTTIPPVATTTPSFADTALTMSDLGSYTFKWYAWGRGRDCSSPVATPTLIRSHELIIIRCGRPYPGASSVLVTGSFDNWKKTVELEKVGDVFEKRVELAMDKKILYKVCMSESMMTLRA